MIKFFTYGTFRQNECRHYILQSFKPEFIKQIETVAKYTLINLGSFPGIIEGGNNAIVGELYDITDDIMAVFDMIEGHPSFFCRKEIELVDGTNAAAYVFQHSIENCDIIMSNDWTTR